MHLDALKRLVVRAASAGARRLTLTRWEWDVAGSCQRPVTREYFARKDRKAPYRENEWRPGDEMPLTLIIHVKCRACSDCRRLRRREWYLRAGVELRRASRSWFGTLTLNPEAHFRCEVVARKRLLRGGTVWESLRPEDRYGETCHEISQALTRYLKRIRKESGATLKYMACFEKHRSGFPHLHVLVHEYSGGGEVKKRQLDSQWKLGFTHFRLVDADQTGRAAMYVAKYISKDGGRVRSSIRYGKTHTSLDIGGLSGCDAGVTPQGITTLHTPPKGTRQRRPLRRYGLGDKVADIVNTADW